mmetsp:Transcript_48936/g.114276  ORF Transcript_48936/g.114276 Transcript_48936/m.114276 type:complete len:238 (-) Transcript_48936:278-991(-)
MRLSGVPVCPGSVLPATSGRMPPLRASGKASAGALKPPPSIRQVCGKGEGVRKTPSVSSSVTWVGVASRARRLQLSEVSRNLTCSCSFADTGGRFQDVAPGFGGSGIIQGGLLRKGCRSKALKTFGFVLPTVSPSLADSASRGGCWLPGFGRRRSFSKVRRLEVLTLSFATSRPSALSNALRTSCIHRRTGVPFGLADMSTASLSFSFGFSGCEAAFWTSHWMSASDRAWAAACVAG